MLSCGIAALYPLAEGRSTLSFLRSAENRPPFYERQRPSAGTTRGTGTKRLVR